MRQPSFKIVLPQDLRAALEAEAVQEGLSLAELMRRRLAGERPSHDHIAKLQALVGVLARLIERSTGQRFDAHPAAAESLRQAISLAIDRRWGEPGARFAEAELAKGMRLIPGTDPIAIGAGIEALTAPDDISIAIEGEDEIASLLDQAIRLLQSPSQGGGSQDEGEKKRPRRRLRKSERK